MKIITESLWLCTDCTIIFVNGDESGVPEGRLPLIHAGIERLAKEGYPALNDGENGEGREDFSAAPCRCCRTKLAGERIRFALFAK